jgi:TRAP transporter TAXI family solute receptor
LNVKKREVAMKTKSMFTMLFVFLITMMQFSPAYAASKFPLEGWPKGVVCGGGSPGSEYYNTMVGLSEMIINDLNVRATAIATSPGSAAAIRGINTKELDFAIGGDEPVYWACTSAGPFEGKPAVKNVRAIAGSSNLVLMGLVTKADSGIKTMEDLKGTGYTISIHPAGSRGFSARADAILQFYNLGPQDVKTVPHSSSEEASAGLKEGRFKVVLDAVYASTPIPWLMELDRDEDIRMIPLSPECIEFIQKRYPASVPGVVPAGLYRGVRQDVATVGAATGMFCRADIPDTFVLELLKVIFEEPTRSKWVTYGPTLKNYTADQIRNFLSPVHKGAVEYYEKKGFWSPQLEEHRKKLLSEFGMKR